MKSIENLVWIDCEMTGLDVEKDSLVEIAVLITDSDLNVLDEQGLGVVIKPRKEFNEMYNTKQWNLKRKCELSKNPLCSSCFVRGIITPANHVDHVFPWSKIGKRAFYLNLFQSLCHECHSHKTTLEQKGVIMWWHDGLAEELNLHHYGEKFSFF
jgi:hypothetical protein